MLEIIILLIVNIALLFLKPDLLTLLILVAVSALICVPGVRAMMKGPPYVPTPKRRVDIMMEFAQPKPGEIAYDLGCGDGRIVFATAKRGAKATGYELSLPTYLVAKIRSLWHPRSRILFRDFWSKSYKDADIIYCYLLKGVMPEFERIVWPQLKPGTRVLSHTFKMPTIKPVKERDMVYMYVK